MIDLEDLEDFFLREMKDLSKQVHGRVDVFTKFSMFLKQNSLKS